MKSRDKKTNSKAVNLGDFSLLPDIGKSGRRRIGLSALVAGNLLLLVGVASFLIINHSASQTVRNSVVTSAIATTNSSSQSPLDQISSAEIALQAAQVANLPEVTSVSNTADSESLLLASVPNESTILASPQIVSTAEKSRYQIVFYRARSGDTASSIAQKYNLSLSSITGSNNLTNDFVVPGTTIVIPPANGVVHKVLPGETVGNIASSFGASRSLFIAVNDAENGVRPGEYVWIPNATSVTDSTAAAGPTYGAFAFGSSPAYGYNGYDFGTCTWYVASRIAVPANWGNANTWSLGASASDWTVSLHPRVGAIAQADSSGDFGYLGHVAIVEAVSPDGSMIKYSDMNNGSDGGGYDRVGYSGWVPAGTFQHYIYR